LKGIKAVLASIIIAKEVDMCLSGHSEEYTLYELCASPENSEEPQQDPETGDEVPDHGNTKQENSKKPTTKLRRSFRPIILCFALMLGLGFLHAQFEGSITLNTTYTDNVFQLSDYDLDRFEANHPYLEFAKSTDDLTMHTQIDLAYPLRYRWWKFTPSVTATLSQNVANQDCYRRDFGSRLKIERYYWNATLQYAYHPNIYVRHYVDSDGSGKPEKYAYERDLYRADIQIKPISKTTVKFSGQFENRYLNEYWTEDDAELMTIGAGLRYRFSTFTLDADYSFRTSDNVNKTESRDASYESDRYEFGFRTAHITLHDKKGLRINWYPALDLSYEERFYQGKDTWYGGREDNIYSTNASLNFVLNQNININLDYTHLFRNVDSPNGTVVQLKEYTENQIGFGLKYSF